MGRIFHDKYFVISTIKSQNDKGDVLRCLYFPKFSLPKICLIKEGKNGMWRDPQGRDISDRLRWQQEVHSDIATLQIVPKIFDLFEENSNHYVAIEYLPAASLARKIADVYKGRTWRQLSAKQQCTLLKHFVHCLDSVEKFHIHGYVHRDLTPENFLISKGVHAYLIDTELSYRMRDNCPARPFVFGTVGYMSPEQQRVEEPTLAEDYYALGACLSHLLTNMNPVQFQPLLQSDLFARLLFFSAEHELADCVIKCLSLDSSDRPIVSALRDKIKEVIESKQNSLLMPFTRPDIPSLKDIEKLTSASSFSLLSTQRWKDAFLFKIGSPHSAGFGLLICGFLFLADDENNKGNLVEFKRVLFNKLYGIDILGAVNKDSPAGLIWGRAGNALLYHYSSRLLNNVDRQNINKNIENCFTDIAENFDLSTGVAGQILALVTIYKEAPTAHLRTRIDELLCALLAGQQRDGSWPLGKNRLLKDRFGLSVGLSGIIVVLLSCGTILGEEKIKGTVEMALKRLCKHKVCNTTFANGSDGIAYAFLLAYQYTGKKKHLSMAERIMARYPRFAVDGQFSLALGIVGRGILYLQAVELTGKKEYLDRAIWIYHVLVNTCIPGSEDTVSWMMNDHGENDGTLLHGSAGMTYFLIKLHAAIKKAG